MEEERVSPARQLEGVIEWSMKNMVYSNALFFAERLHEIQNDSASVNLLATVYYRMGKPQQACAVLRQALNTDDNKYLFAVCSFELGRYPDARFALQGHDGRAPVPNGAAGHFLLASCFQKLGKKKKAEEHLKISLEMSPMLWSSFQTLCSLGSDPDPQKVFGSESVHNCLKEMQTITDQKKEVAGGKKAANKISIQLNNIMLPSDNDGPITDPSEIFNNSGHFQGPSNNHPRAKRKTSIEDSLSIPQPIAPKKQAPPRRSQKPESAASLGRQLSSSLQTPSDHSTPSLQGRKKGEKKVKGGSFMEDEEESETMFGVKGMGMTPSDSVTPVVTPIQQQQQQQGKNSKTNSLMSMMSDETPETDPAISMAMRAPARKRTRPQSSAFHDVTTPDVGPQAPKRMAATNLLASRLLSNPSVLDAFSGTLSPPSFSSRPPSNNALDWGRSDGEESPEQDAKERDAFDEEEKMKKEREALRLLIIDIAEAFRSFHKFDCRATVQKLSSLPPHHLQSGPLQTLLAQAHIELSNYQQAKEIFEGIRRKEPYLVSGMESYSTVLWHLRKEVELSHLAHQLVEFDRLSPQTWCVVGNCFSVQNDHESALKMFQRAIQLDPDFTYAYTLSGHEYIANENFEKAVSSFQTAIAIDERHYNAWYGIGLVYYRQEKYALAEYHLMRALAINPISSVLFCYRGMALQAQEKFDSAISMFDRSLAIDPRNQISRIKRAVAFFHLHRFQESLKDFLELKESLPRDPEIHHMLGKLYSALGDQVQAIVCFNMAIDLDPKSEAVIKQSILQMELTTLTNDAQASSSSSKQMVTE